ncbi:MAG: DNA primase [Syntrophothermus sp.]
MHIPENIIEEVRSSTNIVDIIGEAISIKKRGRNYIGLCPFHSEKTPSFTVSEDKQIYHCFGCHSGGNVFSFLMNYEKISYLEAVQELASRLGITIEYDKGNFNKQNDNEVYYDINTEVGKYFSSNLLSGKEGEPARNYFDKRNIKLKTIREFGLGYAIPSKDALVNFLTDRKLNIEKALDLGLIGRYPSGDLHDKFAGRIIFPIFSTHGRVVAFAGRIMGNAENTAKYLNSPESDIYTKGKILYGLSFAKDEIRTKDNVIMVEGYMDLISLYQTGIKNVVAVSGTALTDDQALLISRYTKNVTLIFDADLAGQKASLRSIEILLKKNMDVKILSLPKDEDPDSFVTKFGKEAFEKKLLESKSFFEYQIQQYKIKGMDNDVNLQTDAIRDVVKHLSFISDNLKINLIIKALAKEFNLRESLLEDELAKQMLFYKQQPYVQVDKRTLKEKKEVEASLVKPPENKIDKEIFNIELELLRILYEGDSKIIEFIFRYITPEDFMPELYDLINLIYEEHLSGVKVEIRRLIEKIPDNNIKSILFSIVMDSYITSGHWEEKDLFVSPENRFEIYAKDTIKRHKIKLLEKQINEVHFELNNTDDEKRTMELLTNKVNLQNEVVKLQNELQTLFN